MRCEAGQNFNRAKPERVEGTQRRKDNSIPFIAAAGSFCLSRESGNPGFRS
jgi:hypothetical protein